MTLPRYTVKRTAAAMVCFAAACCVPPAPEPTPAPPTAPPAAAPAPAPGPARTAAVTPSTNWIDARQTPGDWSYQRVDGGSLARFAAGGNAVFGVGCMAGTGRIALLRYGAPASADVPMVIRTETADRALSAQPASDRQGVSAALPARDPILDAMAFSKGRFAVETTGMPTLYLPSWPEVTRVMEDCR